MILAVAGMSYVAKIAAPLIKLGLDLNGGVSITYQAVEDNPSAQDMSDAVYAVTKDRDRAKHSIRVSLSFKTTDDEVNKFLNAFDECYNKLEFNK